MGELLPSHAVEWNFLANAQKGKYDGALKIMNSEERNYIFLHIANCLNDVIANTIRSSLHIG